MASLVSPGVSVTVIDQSFYIPAAAFTVPLFIIATADHKAQLDGITPASGTYEHGVVRTITSAKQLFDVYGSPVFYEDQDENQFHGDARNEYGLLAMLQFLEAGNVAYAVRANVNLNDDIDELRRLWSSEVESAGVVLENLVNAFMADYNETNNFVPSDTASYKTTVTAMELTPLIEQALEEVGEMYSFYKSIYGPDEISGPELANGTFMLDHTTAPLDVYDSPNTYDDNPTGQFIGIGGNIAAGTTWTAAAAKTLLLSAADNFKFTKQFKAETALGANDEERRDNVINALVEAVGPKNEEIRSENYEYNIVLAPGYDHPKLIGSLQSLTGIIEDTAEVFIIADTPMHQTPEYISGTWASSSSKIAESNLAYYYPHPLVPHPDGRGVVGAASGIALKTITTSDNSTAVWFAPAGTRRGRISGAFEMGYVSGTRGGPTTFEIVHLNQGQRDELYKTGKSVNPLAFFPGRGFVVWGQKTSTGNSSALDRINVSRMVLYVKRAVRKAALPFVFEPNDQITRDNLVAVIGSFLNDLIARRGLYDFAVVSDETNNTPDRIDRNELYVDIALKPVKAAEFIYIPITIVNTGADI